MAPSALTPVPSTYGPLVRRTDTKSYETPKLSIVEMWSVLLSRLKQGTYVIKERAERRAQIEKEISARSDDWCNSIFQEQFNRLEHLTAELEIQLAVTQNLSQGDGQAPSSALSCFALAPWQMEERFRALVQLQSFVGSFFERAVQATTSLERCGGLTQRTTVLTASITTAMVHLTCTLSKTRCSRPWAWVTPSGHSSYF
uniref:Uncharacterized protein n=1 Tax=Bionectria ochroleuca TaxID=29856 RepID=A0A8H7K886_BIOOC